MAKSMTALVLLLLMVGCAAPTPRQVQAVDSSEDRVKFLYNQQMDDGTWERGVIECDIDDKDLQNCRRIEVEYQ